MKRISFDENWPNSWKESYIYDREEIYGEISNRGYAYAYWNRQRHAIEAVRRVAPKGARILDVAAAQGNFSLILAELGYTVVWNDIREELADYVALKYEKGIIQYTPGNVFELGFSNEFDIILITEIIEHVAHPDEFISKIAMMLKPGGYVIMTTPNGEYFRNRLPKFSECSDPSQFESMQFKPNSDGHIFLLHTDEIEGLGQLAGLRIKEIELFTNPLTNGHLRTQLLLRIFPKNLIDQIESLSSSWKSKFYQKINVHMQVVFRKNA